MDTDTIAVAYGEPSPQQLHPCSVNNRMQGLADRLAALSARLTQHGTHANARLAAHRTGLDSKLHDLSAVMDANNVQLLDMLSAKMLTSTRAFLPECAPLFEQFAA